MAPPGVYSSGMKRSTIFIAAGLLAIVILAVLVAIQNRKSPAQQDDKWKLTVTLPATSSPPSTNITSR